MKNIDLAPVEVPAAEDVSAAVEDGLQSDLKNNIIGSKPEFPRLNS